MLDKPFILLVALFMTALPICASAMSGHGTDCASCHKLTEKEAGDLVPKAGGVVTSVKQAPVKGLFEIQMERNGQKGIIYMDYGKKHLMQGMVFDREKLEPVTAHKLEPVQPKQPVMLDVKTIPTKGAILVGNPAAPKKLYVFTDPDCPYCRKAHAELKKLVKIAPDVAVYVVLYPLPMHPGAFDKARIVVETGSQEILDNAFEGKDVPKPVKELSKQIIDENVKYANANGISGTPTLVLPDGRIEVGMRDAETLKKMLEGR